MTPEQVAAAMPQVRAHVRMGLLAFPARQVAGTKQPKYPGWQSKRWDLGMLEAELGKVPYYGLTLPRDDPRRLVIIDLDDGRGGLQPGQIPWQDRWRAIGPLPETKITATPSGGAHAWFLWPDDAPLPGATWHGFTVRNLHGAKNWAAGPGSVRPDGKEYRDLYPERPIATMPSDLARSGQPERRLNGHTDDPPERLTTRADILEFAGRLRYAGAARADIEAALLTRLADGRINPSDPARPWTRDELVTIAADIGSKPRGTSWADPIAADVPALAAAGFTGPGAIGRYLHAQRALSDPDAPKDADLPRVITPLADFLGEPDVPTLDLVPGIAPADALLLWVGQKESFKSMAALTLHVAVATAGEWMGYPVLPMRSVYVSNEKRRRSVRERLRSMIGAATVLHDIGIVHRAGLTLDPNNPRWRRFVDEIDAMGERVLVTLDTLTSLAPVGFKENTPEAMGQALSAVRMLTSLPTPATVNLLHHPAWADAGGKEMRGRGHSSLEGEHDGLLTFTRADREKDEGVIHVRPKDGDYRLLLFTWNRDTMQIGPREVLGRALTTTTAAEIVGGLGGSATVDQVRVALGPDRVTGKPRFSDDRVRTVLNDAVTARLLTTDARRMGHGERTYQVPDGGDE